MSQNLVQRTEKPQLRRMFSFVTRFVHDKLRVCSLHKDLETTCEEWHTDMGELESEI